VPPGTTSPAAARYQLCRFTVDDCDQSPHQSSGAIAEPSNALPGASAREFSRGVAKFVRKLLPGDDGVRTEMVRALDSSKDDALMEQFCRGDEAAFETLYARHAPPVLAFLTRMVRDAALAEDLLACVAISRALPSRAFAP
jgi:hypothetical protein